MSEDSYDLSDSKRSVKELYPVLKDAHGNVIDGFHRLKADPTWKTETLEHIKTPTQLHLARIIANTHRRKVSREEREEQINALAYSLLENDKVPKEKVVSTIAEITTFTYSYVRMLLKDEYKDKDKAHPRANELRENKTEAFTVPTTGMPESSVSPDDSEAPAPGSPEVALSTSTTEAPATPQEYVEQNFRPYQIRTKEDAVAFAWVLTRKYPLTQHEAEVIIREWLKAKQVKPQKSTEKSETEFAVSPLPTSKYEPKTVIDIYSKLEQYYPVTIIDYVVKYTDSTNLDTLVKYCRTYVEKLDLKTSSDLRQTILEEMLK